MDQLLSSVFNGLILGGFYAVVALGLSLIMNLTGTINLAHASFLTLAGYIAYTLVLHGSPFWLALILAPLLTVIVGVIAERTLIRPLYGRDPIYSLLLTFGLALVAEEVFRLIWGANGVPFDAPSELRGTIQLGFMGYPIYRLFIVFVLIIVIGALTFFLRGTRFGLRLRAAILDSEMIAALGT
ncbi:MAG: branched-chain amino acid ABC transporter permease, partial [Vulcanimicrobiaceae bacterium]